MLLAIGFIVNMSVGSVFATGEDEVDEFEDIELISLEEIEEELEEKLEEKLEEELEEERKVEEAQNMNVTSEKNQEVNSILFNDIPTTHWAFKEVNYLSSFGIIQGYQIGEDEFEFRPRNRVTRAQAAKMIVSAIGYEELKNVAPRFKDVQENHWAIGWVEQAFQLGIFTGYDDGTFRPDAVLTRAQMSKIIDEAFSLPVSAAAGQPKAFYDVNDSHWALKHIQNLYYNGISNGNNGRFTPQQDINREQFSALLVRAIDDEFKVPVLPVFEPTKTVAQVTASSSLNVRATPSTSGTVVGRILNGERVPVLEVNGGWVKILFGGQPAYVSKTYVKLINLEGNPVAGRVIVLDAGHGGRDPGAIANGANEKDVVFAVTQLLEKKLRAAGANVLMTRSTDTFLTLAERVEFSKQNHAEMFISIHANAASATSAKGAEVFYNSNTNQNGVESMKLAQEIQKQIVRQASMNDRGVKQQDFFVIKNQNITSVLIELGFLTNGDDAAKLKSPAYQEIFAEAIYQGILAYYK